MLVASALAGRQRLGALLDSQSSPLAGVGEFPLQTVWQTVWLAMEVRCGHYAGCAGGCSNCALH